MVLLAFLVPLSGVALWRVPGALARIAGSDSRIKVVGTLSSRDLARIRHMQAEPGQVTQILEARALLFREMQKAKTPNT